MQGAQNKNELHAIHAVLKDWNVRVIHIDEAVSTHALWLVRDYGLSHGVRLADALIAATAIDAGQSLLTGNTKHFSCIPSLDTISFERSL
jgi:predicted nucleic acid-binding protein